MEDSTKFVRYPKVREFLEREFMRYMLREGMRGSIAAWARALEMEPVSLGRYMQGTYKPGSTVQDKLAEKLGPGIYLACDTTPKVPKDKDLLEIVNGWHDLPRGERNALFHDFQEALRRAKEREAEAKALIEDKRLPSV
jgi:hypothetical protein